MQAAGQNARPDRQPRPDQLVHYFGKVRTEGSASQRELLGGKGANLAEMTSIGLPVPPGFTITTAVCAAYYKSGERLPAGLMDDVNRCIADLERETGKAFGSESNPLLMSVRSGAAVSMPGMMDTVLNLGLTDRAVRGLAKITGNERFAYDAYRRLINMFGDVVMGVEHKHFEAAFDRIKKKHKAKVDADVGVDGMRELCEAYQQVYRKHVGSAFPQDPLRQLELAIEAVFRSWNAPRAVRYREISGIEGLQGTAVNGQVMVFGNMGDDSGTGVAFTRDPSTGANQFYGEFLVNAQGEDVVAGIRTPRPVAEMRTWDGAAYEQLLEIKSTLENHFREMQDLEFTIERGHLYMLQTRTGERTAAAAVKIAVDMVDEGLIDRAEAVQRMPAENLTQLLLPSFAETLAFTAEETVQRTLAGEDVLLVRKETSPEDVDGMHHAVGILTSTGGMTSHAAVVARGWGKCCIAGAGGLEIDSRTRSVRIDGRTFTHKDILSIDGTSGEVMAGKIKRSAPRLSPEFNTLMGWADEFRRLRVRTNADTPTDAKRARDYGAEGIGLCRTEHMFFEGERIRAMREMILAESKQQRERALKKLLPIQRRDFIGLFTAMKSLPVTVRLLDPPLHEFLPRESKSQKELAVEMGVPPKQIQRRVAELHEMNPMLGHRGCRLAVSYPEILVMQVTAIVEAMLTCRKKGVEARPEIMIPLVGSRSELAALRKLTQETIDHVVKAKKYSGKVDIPIGTMIEVPRAAVVADEIAEIADFFSFGTNDLTQLAFGFSRDDINAYLPDYLEQKLLEADPFQTLDESGVGQLVEIACRKGRRAKAGLKLGICGEHGG
ncbi:MAG: pyruvate, phosphate dikinase, partial [Planctomycetota bacterium]